MTYLFLTLLIKEHEAHDGMHIKCIFIAKNGKKPPSLKSLLGKEAF
jgi:hypothetical protein